MSAEGYMKAAPKRVIATTLFIGSSITVLTGYAAIGANSADSSVEVPIIIGFVSLLLVASLAQHAVTE